MIFQRRAEEFQIILGFKKIFKKIRKKLIRFQDSVPPLKIAT